MLAVDALVRLRTCSDMLADAISTATSCSYPFYFSFTDGEIVSTQPLTHYLIKTHTCSVAVSDTYNTVTQDITVNIESKFYIHMCSVNVSNTYNTVTQDITVNILSFTYTCVV